MMKRLLAPVFTVALLAAVAALTLTARAGMQQNEDATHLVPLATGQFVTPTDINGADQQFLAGTS
jgi:hypothetical protein